MYYNNNYYLILFLRVQITQITLKIYMLITILMNKPNHVIKNISYQY